MKTITVLLSLILLFGKASFSQETGDIITDRPDQSESAVTMSKGFIQVELGGTYEYDKISSGDPLVLTTDFRTVSAPSFLIRYGLAKKIELRLSGEFISQKTSQSLQTITQSSESSTVNGIAPLVVGAKFRLFDERNSRPEAAILASLSIPVFDNAFKTQHLGAEVRLALANTLTEKLGVSYNIGAEWDGEDNTNPTGLYTLAFGLGINNNLSAFAEVYGFLRNGSEPDHRLDGGFTYLLAKNVQADISGGIGITETAPDFFIGAGVSFRLPR